MRVYCLIDQMARNRFVVVNSVVEKLTLIREFVTSPSFFILRSHLPVFTIVFVCVVVKIRGESSFFEEKSLGFVYLAHQPFG